MSERKTIQINPDLFNIKNTTRKKPPKIELKSELKTQKQKTLRKNVLKMIREKQQEAYRELFDNKKSTTTHKPANSIGEFNKDFDNSLQFFSSLADKVKTETPPPNTTFKRYEPINTQNPNPFIFPPIIEQIPIADCAPISLSPFPFPKENDSNPLHQIRDRGPLPLYGCLKNGTLPTYRSYSRKNNDNGAYTNGSSGAYAEGNETFMTPQIPIFDTPLLTRSFEGGSPSFAEQSQKFEKIHQGKITPFPNEKQKEKQKIRYKKRKKIFKRTYKVGRSKTEPKIGVLVSNKTIRTRISTEAQLLKQTPIYDVRKFLIKKGFIKVGTNAPNDVLRKMYETVSLVCGEIQNHNPENLLYNYIHDKE